VLGFNRIDVNPIHLRSEVDRCDVIIFLDETLWEEGYLKDLKPGAFVLINSSKHFEDPRVFSMDATGMALEILGKPMANTAMLGFLAAKAPAMVSQEACAKAIEKTMGASLAKGNLGLFHAAFSAGKGC
jgi:pyruvate ferredoxin oxidoreductase gamma subunit